MSGGRTSPGVPELGNSQIISEKNVSGDFGKGYESNSYFFRNRFLALRAYIRKKERGIAAYSGVTSLGHFRLAAENLLLSRGFVPLPRRYISSPFLPLFWGVA